MNMNDLNLIPQHIRIEQEKKAKRRKNILLSVVISLVIIGITLLPVYLTHKISMENMLIQESIAQLSFVSEEINKLNAQKKEVQDIAGKVEGLSNQEKKWTGIINDFSSLMPSSITFLSLNCDADNIYLDCTSKSRDDIAVFVGKLENSDKFIDVKINEIKKDEQTSVYSFDMQMKPKTTGSKVKK